MTVGLAAIGLIVVIGGVVAASARDPRVAILGLALALVSAPTIADPLPDSLSLAIRILGGLLAAQFLWIARRGRPEATIAAPLGWPAELLGAGAAAILGWGLTKGSIAVLGPPEAIAAGTALIVLSARPIAFGREPFRIGIGMLLLLTGVLLIQAGVVGAPGSLERIIEAGLTAAVGAAVAWRIRLDEPVRVL